MFGDARRKIEEIKQSSLSFPSDNLFIQIDGMDNSKSYLPRYLEHSKDLVQKERLPTKISGCIIHSGWYEEKRKVLFYLNHDIFEQGSNLIITLVHLLLQEFQKDFGKFPKKLHINADNCWKENKNRFLFSYLASLVELEIFDEVSLNYLLVGHTGNEVDQLFSCLCTVLKDDIVTLEMLKEKIVSSSILPKPICRSLSVIYDWKNFIYENLTQPPLEHHSLYNSFLLSSKIIEGKRCVVLRGKKLPQDTQMVPRAGIRVIKENITYDPVGPAEYRIESIRFDEIMRGLYVYLARLPVNQRIPVIASWDRLRDWLESLPNRSRNFPSLIIKDFPKQQAEVLQVPDYLLDEEDDGKELTGDKYPETVDEGNVDDDMHLGMDVCIYGDDKKGRPWVGRVKQVLEDRRFLIQWYTRKTVRSKIFYAETDSKGDPVVSEQENDSIMFWSMSENRTERSFSLSNFWLETIEREYETYDK